MWYHLKSWICAQSLCFNNCETPCTYCGQHFFLLLLLIYFYLLYDCVYRFLFIALFISIYISDKDPRAARFLTRYLSLPRRESLLIQEWFPFLLTFLFYLSALLLPSSYIIYLFIRKPLQGQPLKIRSSGPIPLASGFLRCPIASIFLVFLF